ncbi:hypothetical protein F5884DRAFT_889820 [Xylogone sp. PMI_703]|nr:hypothetical protein F5884DRAFT_889820 [Xylogone sp. PMI_703]
MSDSPVPSTMQAWVFSSPGRPTGVLRYDRAHLMPNLSAPTDVLIRVSYTALSSAGMNLMNSVPSFFRKQAIPELDFSGFIVKVGLSVPMDLKPGTPVFGSIPALASILHNSGALAEYVVVPANSVMTKPQQMEMSEASGLTSLAHTAIKLLEKSKIKAADKVLLNGGGGDVGAIALQAAVACGATVVATCSASKSDMVASLGASEIRQSSNTSLAEKHGSEQFDIILDTVGSQDLYTNSPAYLKPRGIYVNVGTVGISQGVSLWRWFRNSTYPRLLGGVPRTFIMFNTVPDKPRAIKIDELAEDKKLRVPVDSIFQIEDALKGYERMQAGNRNGRILIEIPS